MKLKNIILGLIEQLPIKRAFINFFVTKNAWGMFHKNSHLSTKSGKHKIEYGSKESARRAADNMQKKYGNYYSVYKCIFCDGYHIGKNRDNK